MQSTLPPASQIQLKKWTKLLQGKYRSEEGLFLAEGVKVVYELFKSDWTVEAILVLPEKTAHCENLRFPRQIPVYQLSLSDFKKLSQDKEPEGVIAVVKMKEPQDVAELSSGTPGYLLIAHEIANPQNLGALLRTARWFGFKGIVLGSHCVDWAHPKVIRASMGAVFHLGIWPDVDLPAFLPQIKKQYRVIGSDVRSGAVPCPSAEGTALLLGSESHGLPENLLKLADERWRIPGDAKAESLSLPQAAAIMMYEMSKTGGW